MKGTAVGNFQLLPQEHSGEGHSGEVYAVAYSTDGSFILSAGWDGHLCFWDANRCRRLNQLQACNKPLSCCAISPTGQHWLSGSMEGLITIWDSVSHHLVENFIAHTRPISSITYSPQRDQLATTSWDRQVVLRKVGKERDGKVLLGHTDIVSGCCFSAAGSHLLSWSHDRNLMLWNTTTGARELTLTGHGDRVTAAAMSPDGRLAVSGSRDGMLKVWDLEVGTELCSLLQVAEISGIFFTLDGESVVSVDANGWLVMMAVPVLDLRFELNTGIKVISAAASPLGTQIALGGEDGLIHLINIEGLEDNPLPVTAKESVRITSTFFSRLFGQSKAVNSYSYICPACQQAVETSTLPVQTFPCPTCQRHLRVARRVTEFQNQ